MVLFDCIKLSKILLHNKVTGRVAQLVTCLTADACLTANPGVTSSIPAQSYTFVDIDHEIISTVIACCQFQVKVCARNTG